MLGATIFIILSCLFVYAVAYCVYSFWECEDKQFYEHDRKYYRGLDNKLRRFDKIPRR